MVVSNCPPTPKQTLNCPADYPRPADHRPQPAAPAATAEGELIYLSVIYFITIPSWSGAADCAAEVAAAAADQAVPAAGLKTIPNVSAESATLKKEGLKIQIQK